MGIVIAWLLIAFSADYHAEHRAVEHIVLLPSQDGKASAVIVQWAGGATLIDQPYLSAEIDPHGRITPTANEAGTVRAQYRSTLAALPQRAAVFTLYFVTDSDALVPESAARLQQIKQELAQRPAPEIIVIGHTDTVAKADYNDALSLRRADTVKHLLMEIGIAESSITISGRGMREPLVATGPGVDEPLNRRVEIRVR